MLTKPEIFRIVEDYIGVEAGNLQHFSYKTLGEFFPYYCELEVDPAEFGETKRTQFIGVLEKQDSRGQAKILRGLLAKLPPESRETEGQRRSGAWIESLVKRLDGAAVAAPTLAEQSRVVRIALENAEILVREQGPVDAIDRVHTALHGYLKQACTDAAIDYAEDPSLSKLYALLRKGHPALSKPGPHLEHVERVMNSLAQGIDALNPIRNRGSVAHPNEDLLGEDEAIFVRNAANTILTYLDSKFRARNGS